MLQSSLGYTKEQSSAKSDTPPSYAAGKITKMYLLSVLLCSLSSTFLLSPQLFQVGSQFAGGLL